MRDEGGPGLVIAAAVIRDARVLSARRTAPASAAGRWELPGGKVEPGERAAAAVIRELCEELGCLVRVTGWLAGRSPIGADLELAVATAVLVAGEPQPVEHDQVRWLGAAELAEVDWLEPDRLFLAELAAVLSAAEPRSEHGRAVPREPSRPPPS